MDSNQKTSPATGTAMIITIASIITAIAMIAIVATSAGADEEARPAATTETTVDETVTSDTVTSETVTSETVTSETVTSELVEMIDPVHQRPIETSFWAPVGDDRNDLIVLSHGFAGDRSSHDDTAALLAASGYTVIAPTHPDLAGLESGVAELDPLTLRPRHLSLAIDTAIERNGGAFDDVTVIGHSMGGYAALRVAGANPQVGPLLVDYCDAAPSDQILCSPLAEGRFEALGGTDSSDPRVTNIVVFAPAYGPLFDTAGLDIDTPILVVTASGDDAVPAMQTDGLVARLEGGASTADVTSSTIEGDHFVFLRPCTAEEAAVVPELCDTSIDRASVHADLVSGPIAAFLGSN